MILSLYRKAEGLSQAKFAERMTAAGFPATQALVSQWESGAVILSAERCIQIEQVTGAKVTRAELRPDLFGGGSVPPQRLGAANTDEGDAAQADGTSVPPVSEAA